MLKRPLCAALAVCALSLALLSTAFAQDETRGPTTQEERMQALVHILHFSGHPLSPEAKAEAQSVIPWVIGAPDIHVSLCLVVDLPAGTTKHSDVLFTAMMMGEIGYAIQHKDDRPDDNSEYVAGMHSMLNAYEMLIAADPNDRQPAIDDLLQRRLAGTLREYVTDLAASSCRKD